MQFAAVDIDGCTVLFCQLPPEEHVPSYYGYKAGCRCEDCHEAVRSYNRDYFQRKRLNMKPHVDPVLDRPGVRLVLKNKSKWVFVDSGGAEIEL